MNISIVYMYMHMGRLFCMPHENFMDQSDCSLCVYICHKLYATQNFSEHTLQPKTLYNFGMESASVDVAILQLKRRIYVGLFGYFLKTGICNEKNPNLEFLYIPIVVPSVPCLVSRVRPPPRSATFFRGD